MPIDIAKGFLQRAQQYLRTAETAASNKDWDAAFENARTAAELAAKSMLHRTTGDAPNAHNVSSALVKAGLWPKSKGAELSKFLAEYTRGVYGFTKPVKEADVRKALRSARDIVQKAS